MIARWLRRPWWVVLLALVGCDPNPGGPSAPSAAPGGETPSEAAPAKGDPKITPLRQVGKPIGSLAPVRTDLRTG